MEIVLAHQWPHFKSNCICGGGKGIVLAHLWSYFKSNCILRGGGRGGGGRDTASFQRVPWFFFFSYGLSDPVKAYGNIFLFRVKEIH